MNIDVSLVLEEYDKLIVELNRKVILLRVENDQLKKQLDDRKDSE